MIRGFLLLALVAAALSSREAAAKEAVVLRVTPGAGLAASTYNPAAFRVENRTSRKIASLRIDLSTAVLPDLLFDPAGTAGDTVGKPFTVDGGAVETWLTRQSLERPASGGYRRLAIEFQDFGAGKAMAFSIDVDPASIKGTEPPGPGDSGSVSGAEMMGATIIVGFDGGRRQVGHLMADPTDPGAAVAVVDGTEAPALLLRRTGTHLGIAGPAGAPVTIVQIDVAAFGGRQPNSIVALQGWTADLDARGHGQLDLPFAQSDFAVVVAAIGRAAGPWWGAPTQPMAWPRGELMGEVPR